MKIRLTILFSISILIGSSQTNPDSLRFSKTDSIPVFLFPDSLVLDLKDSTFFLGPNPIPHYTSYLPKSFLMLFYIPNCSELIKKNELFYFIQDSTPYCGQCVVTNDGKGITVQYHPNQTMTETAKREGEIKIISNYKDGKRHGQREYYDKNGKQYKIETYVNGKLISTEYFD